MWVTISSKHNNVIRFGLTKIHLFIIMWLKYFFFFGLVNYAITNYEKHYIDDITADNSICFMKIHV